jgi:hypothetical protein
MKAFATQLFELCLFKYAIIKSKAVQRLIMENGLYKIVYFLIENIEKEDFREIWESLVHSKSLRDLNKKFISVHAAKDSEKMFKTQQETLLFYLVRRIKKVNESLRVSDTDIKEHLDLEESP